MQLIKGNKIILLCCGIFLLGAAMQKAFSISPNLNYPRIGDELTLLGLNNISLQDVPNDKYVDISNSNILTRSKFKVYAPANDDSLTTMVIVANNRYHSLVFADDVLYETKTYQPGEYRSYNPHIPYGLYIDSLRTHSVESAGASSRIGKFSSSGYSSAEVFSGLTLITLDGDTLSNIECIITKINEVFQYPGVDTLRHVGLQKQWFVPGYRYPALSFRNDNMISVNGDTIDRVCKWEAIDLKQQEDNINDDLLNELLRNSLRDGNYNILRKQSKPDSNNYSFKHTGIDWNEETKILSVLPGAGIDNREADYVLCDVKGVVYASGCINNSELFTVSLNSYSPGIYIFGLMNNNGFNSFKIIIP